MSENAAASVTHIQAVDALFFALVFLIFSYGVITLFINREDEAMMKLPKWLHIETIGQLKTTLVQVMIVILEVNLLKHGLVVRSESIRGGGPYHPCPHGRPCPCTQADAHQKGSLIHPHFTCQASGKLHLDPSCSFRKK